MHSSNCLHQQKCYLEIDYAYTSWYLKVLGEDIDHSKYAIPLGQARQGHLEAGALREQMANSILKDPELGFKATTHEHNLFCGVVHGDTVCTSAVRLMTSPLHLIPMQQLITSSPWSTLTQRLPSRDW
jgi:hypothetical protein